MKKIISIYGPTAIGKTTIVKEVEKALGYENCTRISLDKYLKTKDSNEDKLQFLTNDPVDWELILEQITLPVGTQVKRPKYDHNTYIRVGIDEEHETIIREIIIIDGAWPYKDADIKVQLELDSLKRLQRLILRYFNEWNKKGETWIKFATENWERLPGYHHELKADITINTEQPLSISVQKLLSLINAIQS